MHAQPAIRHTASDPGARSRFAVWKIIAIALAVIIVIVVAVEVLIRTQSTIAFRGNTYKVANSSCSNLPDDLKLTTIGSTFGHPINGPSSIDQPAVIYLRCFPTGYITYSTTGT